jgi:transcriptional regulator with XRE-family HTH domain
MTASAYNCAKYANGHNPMIGEKLRELRQGQQLSLTDVASKAKISAATLSRIENEKQALDVEMLFSLARILKTSPDQLVADGNGGATENEEELAERISALSSTGRAQLWRDLASNRRTRSVKRRESREMGERIEELLAQVDFLRGEIESVRTRLKKK